MNLSKSIGLLFVIFIIVEQSLAQSPVGDVVGKLVVGYQGWFTTSTDGNPRKSWFHWTIRSGSPPNPGNCKFEVYPDTREYQKLYPTGLANLGNGQPAQLFSSWDQSTVSLHFMWMQQYGIDTAALQRFGAGTFGEQGRVQYTLLNGVADNVRISAERYGRKFFIMYDLSGWKNFTTEIVEDINRFVGNLTKSPAYARQNGKPVICIWGIGFRNVQNDATGTQNVINQLKTMNYYVMGGVPNTWRTNDGISIPEYASVYRSLNMIQPWAVGTFDGINGAQNYRTREDADLQECRRLGIDYQPVVFPGFAWSNWNGGARNVIPRLNGTFMWQQFKNIRSLQCPNVYVAMFDEYDEGTAIAKAAENVQMIPTNQYFLTLDADGGSLSSDFYLRLCRDGIALMRGQIPLTNSTTPPTPHRLPANPANPANNARTASQVMNMLSTITTPRVFSMLQSLFGVLGII